VAKKNAGAAGRTVHDLTSIWIRILGPFHVEFGGKRGATPLWSTLTAKRSEWTAEARRRGGENGLEDHFYAYAMGPVGVKPQTASKAVPI
jgi:hypothetical protein